MSVLVSEHSTISLAFVEALRVECIVTPGTGGSRRDSLPEIPEDCPRRSRSLPLVLAIVLAVAPAASAPKKPSVERVVGYTTCKACCRLQDHLVRLGQPIRWIYLRDQRAPSGYYPAVRYSDGSEDHGRRALRRDGISTSTVPVRWVEYVQ